MKFDEYLQEELTPKRLPSSWVSNTKFVFQSDDGSLAILDTANDSLTTLVTNHTMVSNYTSFVGLWVFDVGRGLCHHYYFAHKLIPQNLFLLTETTQCQRLSVHQRSAICTIYSQCKICKFLKV